ncbi:TPA: hypothetical protein ACP7Q5_004897 [Escherichia coli]|jgi:hypothetical protein|nr:MULTISPECIES: hypothetical protein [Bacilli]ELG7158457.1 hypothetical protein [Staphylococcus aureus]HDH7443221.1 hypothetical protein [Escherichia coli]ELL1201567.1 hypothetical protein [Staphylococcus aureus]MDH9287369.1 hypothetical protein [Staphylococcus epidermidis]MDN3040716.1 hypothetical protein [Enterococcus faecium]
MRVDIQEQKRFPTYIADLEVGELFFHNGYVWALTRSDTYHEAMIVGQSVDRSDSPDPDVAEVHKAGEYQLFATDAIVRRVAHALFTLEPRL